MKESMKIFFIAKPNIPDEIVERTAKTLKYNEIYDRKLKELENRSKLRSTKNKKGDKKGKNKEKPSKEKKSKKIKQKNETEITDDKITSKVPEPVIIVKDEELKLDYSDFYPAEMVYWRNLEPYYIKSKFICNIEYESQKIHKKKDTLYLDTICKVTRPDFITNLQQQRIDFGTCLIGMKVLKKIILQNISYRNIRPKVSLLNPCGNFTLLYVPDIKLPPEYFLEIPFEFSPQSNDEQVIEYVEISSNLTTVSIILCGQGVAPHINITPLFEVFRVETKFSKLAEVTFKVQNASEGFATIEFQKIFEIEASISDINNAEVNAEEKPEENKNSKKGKEKKSKASTKGSKKEKKPKFSDSLTEKELEIIEKYFKKSKGDEHFQLKSATNIFNLEAASTQNVTVLCGEPDVIFSKKSEPSKKAKKGKMSETHGSTSKSPRESQKVFNNKQYITQYNVHAGRLFIKKLILICTITN